MKISYYEIKNKIKENCMKGLYFVTEYIDDNQKNDILSFTLGKNENTEEKINSLVQISTAKYTIYEYESTDVLTTKKTENFLICENNLPVFKIKHYQPKNSNVEYTEDIYITYKDRSNRINSKISINTFKNEDFEKDDIHVLDTDNYSGNYYQKNYQFMIKSDQILSLKIGNDIYLVGEESFANRCHNALKCIGNVLNKVTQKIEQATDDNVKTYCIKRHK